MRWLRRLRGDDMVERIAATASRRLTALMKLRESTPETSVWLDREIKETERIMRTKAQHR